MTDQRRTGKYLKCQECGQEVYVRKSRIKKFKYCSMKCLGIVKARRLWKNHEPRMVQCSNCGELKKHFAKGYCHSCSVLIDYYSPKGQDRYHQYYLKNKDKIKERSKEWKKTFKGKLYNKISKMKRRNNWSLVEIKETILDNWIKHGLHFCEKCGDFVGDLDSPFYHIDHIIPVSRNGDNTATNLQILCAKCNFKKGTDIVDYRGMINA